MNTYERIKSLRKSMRMSQEELAHKVGYRDRSSIAKVEKGEVDISESKIKAFAQALNVTPLYLLGIEEKQVTLIPIPVIASVSAGFDHLAVIDGEDFELLPSSELHGYSASELRIFKVKGDSMYPRILDGDKVLVHIQPSVDSGDTAVVVYNGEEATIKKVRYASGEDWMELIPANPEYQTKRIEGKDLEHCHVVGKIIKLIRDF